jgi:DNA-binding NarL/FixJ family response regulator
MTSSKGKAGNREKIRVFVVDDHAVVRRGMRAFLEMVDDMDVVGEASDGRQALDEIEALIAVGRRPDVVMMDLVMPRLDGIAASASIKHSWPEIEVVAMTSFSEAARVHGALEAGAAGYLLKDAEADELVAAIRGAHRGEVHLDPAIASQVARSLQGPHRKVLKPSRSGSERSSCSWPKACRTGRSPGDCP